jgi:DNA-binding beta-propeller fold protein YncE
MARYTGRFVYVLFLLSALFIACDSTPRPGTEYTVAKTPDGIIPIQEIKGEYLGHTISIPKGLTSDNSGNLYIVDAGNNRVIRFDNKYKAIRDVGGFGIDEGYLNSPEYVTIDNNLNIYVSDGGNRRVIIYDARLNFADYFDLHDADDPLKFGQPSGLTVNNFGEVFVADRDNSRVIVFNAAGAFDRFIADRETSAGRLLTPAGMRTDRDKNIYVCDIGSHGVEIFDESGVNMAYLGDEILGAPSGVDFDRFGNVWVVDKGASFIYCFSSKGQLLLSVGSDSHGFDFGLDKPHDIKILPNDRLAVSDTGHDRVIIYQIIFPE